MTFTEFAALLEGFGDPSSAAVTTETVVTKKLPSQRLKLVGVMSLDGDSKKTANVEKDEDQDDDMDIQLENKLAKIRGEFYRSGNDTSVFTTRRRRKMSPTIQGMMGEAHLRFARGDLDNAIDICLEIIKEREKKIKILSFVIFSLFVLNNQSNGKWFMDCM